MKKGFLCLCLLSFAQLVTAADIGSPGDIHFTLTVNEATCLLAKENIEVEMGKMILPRPINVGRVIAEKDFTIGLTGCSNTARAYVTLDGTPDDDDSSLFALDDGGATGVAINITGSDGQQQVPKVTDPTPREFAITEENVNLNYTARYVVTSTKASSGRADALINFSISYE